MNEDSRSAALTKAEMIKIMGILACAIGLSVLFLISCLVLSLP